MNVQVIVREGEPEYAVVPWTEYQALLQAAGRPQASLRQPAKPEAPRPALHELSTLRQQKGLSLEALGRAVGISPAYLEMIALLDARAERPLRSALVVSQSVGRLPREGFFACAARLGRYAGSEGGPQAASWHAGEMTRVYEFDYPEVP